MTMQTEELLHTEYLDMHFLSSQPKQTDPIEETFYIELAFTEVTTFGCRVHYS